MVDRLEDLKEVGPEVHLVDLTEVGQEGRLEDLKEVGQEGRLEDLMVVAPVGLKEVLTGADLEDRLVDHLERARVLRLYRKFPLRVLAPRLEFQPLLVERFLILEFLLLAKSALLQELGSGFPFLLGHQRLRQTYHLLQRFFHPL